MGVGIEGYFETIAAKGAGAAATLPGGTQVPIDDALHTVIRLALDTHGDGGKIMVIGNGGSAAIASHLATDYTKNGGLRTQVFLDGSMLTCLGNDLGFDQIFARQIEMFARPGDLLVAISSSGRSPDILKGVAAARSAGCRVVTFSGFDDDNPLRGLGDVNFHVASHTYGIVEIAHLGLCHAILDMAMGVFPAAATVPAAC